MSTHFRIKQSSDGQWRWSLIGGNNEKMASGEPHPTEALARRAISRIKRKAMFASVRVVK